MLTRISSNAIAVALLHFIKYVFRFLPLLMDKIKRQTFLFGSVVMGQIRKGSPQQVNKHRAPGSLLAIYLPDQ